MNQIDLFKRETLEKERGMQQASSTNNHSLQIARNIASLLANERESISIEDVRDYAATKGIFLFWGNWAGSVFKGKQWEFVGYTKRYHKRSHGGEVKKWRLKSEIKAGRG